MTLHEYLGPSSEWIPLVAKGAVTINRAANRLVWPDGQFAAALAPTVGITERLAKLPVNAESVQAMLETAKDLVEVRPALEMLQLVSSIGAVASVANVGISLVGFAAVLQKLKRIEGKLDQMMMTLDGLRHAVASLGVKTDTFLMARLASAKENLDRSIAASSERERIELARDARRLFQEGRLRYLELWRHVDPWRSLELEIPTAMELQGRYVAMAIGELQAELILGDRGAFVHANRSAVTDLRQAMSLDPLKTLRLRSDAECERVGSKGYTPLHHAGFLSGTIERLATQLKLAEASTRESADRLEAFEADADLPAQLNLPAHEVLRLLQEAPGIDIVALGKLEP